MTIDLISGIGCVAVAILLYGASFLEYKRENRYRSLLLIVLAGFVLRVYCAMDPMLHKWDERYHALVAKNLIAQPLEPRLYQEHVFDFDSTNWTANEVWLHKPPLALWTMALSLRIFGVDEFALRIPSVLLSSLCIFLTFLIGRSLYSEKIGLLAAAFHSINGLIIELAAGRVATDHVDTFFLFFIEVSVFFLVRGNGSKNENHIPWNLILAGVACGLAILTKWLPALVVFPLYLVLHANGQKSLWRVSVDLMILGLTALVVAGPWQVYAFTHFPTEYRWEQHFNTLHFAESLEGHGQPAWFFLDRIRITVNEAVYVALLWFIYFVVKEKHLRRSNLFVGTWIAIPLVVFSIATSKMQGYLLFSFPAYFLVLALFAEKLFPLAPNRSAWVYLSKLAAIALFALAFRYGLERIKPLQTRTADREAKAALTGLALPPRAVLFNMPCPVEAMFYAGGTAYAHIPDPETVNRLIAEKYALYVVDDGNLAAAIQQDDRIHKVDLPAVMGICR